MLFTNINVVDKADLFSYVPYFFRIDNESTLCHSPILYPAAEKLIRHRKKRKLDDQGTGPPRRKFKAE
ncbi:hypothetical protein MFLAVUS_000415 [Mucor flavus]|uniref:Uncharacterized protein n=1 Tax=Mucor flavus TaxID=439312 RepID=A0ABP9YJN2_9FUNG